MRFRELVAVSDAVAETRSRLEKVSRLAEFLKRLRDDEIRIAVAFLSGSPRQGRIGVGWGAISRARAVEPSLEPSLQLAEADDVFGKVAAVAGAGVVRTRAQLLSDLFRRSTATEQDFLIRLLSGDLRQGALEGVLADAVAKAAGVPVESIRQAAMMSGDLGEAAHAVLTAGPEALSRYTIQLFRPVEPMLASTAETVGDALAAFGEAAFEIKLDGARIQAHKDGDDVKVYSRALRDVTAAVPEVVESVRALPARELILDGEVLVLARDRVPLPFQETMRRFGRRLDVEELRKELPLTPYFFDCLYVDAQSLVSQRQHERFSVLKEIAAPHVVPHRTINEVDEARRFFDEAIAGGHEGVMAKSLLSPYAAGSRGSAWLKIKNVRTLDLVVLAAEWGSGRRRGWLSNLHLGARDPERNRFVMLGKTFKGLTDEVLVWQTAALLEREVRREGHVVHVRPELVVEIAFNDIQASPQYPGGLALRFARVKAYRPDKTPDQADTLETLQNIFRATTGRDAPPVRA